MRGQNDPKSIPMAQGQGNRKEKVKETEAINYA